MLTAVVTQVGGSYTVRLTDAPPNSTPVEETNSSGTSGTSDDASSVTIADAEGETDVETEVEAGEEEEHHENVTLNSDGYVATDGVAHIGVDEAAPGPNPIIPEMKELAWGAGAFIVFALVMRYLAFPRLKKGMDARYNGIQSDHEQADAARAAARAEVAEYQAQLASVKAEAAAHLDQARQELEAKRTSRIAAANAQIAERRAAATAENDAARLAVQSQIKGAVADVSSSAIRLAIGKDPDPMVVQRVVDDVMSAGAAR